MFCLMYFISLTVLKRCVCRTKLSSAGIHSVSFIGQDVLFK